MSPNKNPLVDARVATVAASNPDVRQRRRKRRCVVAPPGSYRQVPISSGRVVDLLPQMVRLSAGHGAEDDERLRAGDDLVGQRRVG